jgi:hypothetical protein
MRGMKSPVVDWLNCSYFFTFTFMKLFFVLITVIVIIPIIGAIYWDFFMYDSLDNPDLTSTWTGIHSSEVKLEQIWNHLHITWFFMRTPSKEFSHFNYLISWNDIYIWWYKKSLPILFDNSKPLLNLTLKSTTYKVYYKNSDGSAMLIKSITVSP